MKKYLGAVVCFCLLAIFVPAVKLDAATLPWSSTTTIKGQLKIGQTVSAPAAVSDWWGQETSTVWYQMNVTAGQTYYLDAEWGSDCDVSVYRYDSTEKSSAYIGNSNGSYYAVASEVWYVEIENSDTEAVKVSLSAGQKFTKTVTKQNGKTDNVYYYTPTISGAYTFQVTSSDADVNPYLSIGYMKRGRFNSLSSKEVKGTYSFGMDSVTATLQAGKCYAIYVDTGSYSPYTLSLTQTPSVPVAAVTAKKATSKTAKKAVVTWKKAAGISGYQVTYSLKKTFKKSTTKNVSSKKLKVTLKKLKSGKKYYVKVRAYKTVGGQKYYGAYSKTLTVKVK